MKTEHNTPGTAGGPGGRDRTLAAKSKKFAQKYTFFRKKIKITWEIQSKRAERVVTNSKRKAQGNRTGQNIDSIKKMQLGQEKGSNGKRFEFVKSQKIARKSPLFFRGKKST